MCIFFNTLRPKSFIGFIGFLLVSNIVAGKKGGKKKMFRFQGLTQRGEEAYVIARWRAMAMISAAAKGYG